MSNTNKSIHEFDLELICEYYATIDRQGPGSPEITLKALSFVEALTSESQIVDIGCGTGGQTMTLAKYTTGQITGVDLFPRFIDLFQKNARALNLQHRVKGRVGTMEALPFQEESLDLIWSEGAIYNIGFERGLKEWRKFLKEGGYIAVSEASWFTNERPDEIEAFWMDAYPQIDTIPNKLQQLQNAGYIPIASFILPETCWTEQFYEPQIKAREAYLQQNVNNIAAREFIANQRHETSLYYKYKDFYGYAFYIGKKQN